MKISRRLLSLIAALVFAIAGLGLVWSSGFTVYVELMRFGSATPNTIAPTLGLVLGGLLFAAAAATVAISSLGALVVGGVFTITGLLGVLPSIGGMEPFSIVGFRFFLGTSDGLSSGITIALACGVVLVVGLILLVAGLVVHGRRRGSGRGSLVARLTSVLALPLVLCGLYLVSSGGGILYSQYVQRMSYAWEPMPLLQVLAGAVLFAIAAVSLRWTALGVGVAGAVLFLLGLLGLLLSRDLLAVIADAGVPGPAMNGIISLMVTGQYLLIAGALLGAAVGSKIAASRAARAHETRLDAPAPAPVV